MIRARPGRYSHDVPLPESRLACRRESRETLSSREGGVGELHEAEDSCCLAFDKPRDVRDGSTADIGRLPRPGPVRDRTAAAGRWNNQQISDIDGGPNRRPKRAIADSTDHPLIGAA